MHETETQRLAATVTAMLKEGRFRDVMRDHWADTIVAIEPPGQPMHQLAGREAVMMKVDWWSAHHEIHGCEIDGPFVNGDMFALVMALDVTSKDGARMTLREIVTYRVADGRIAEERYFYGS
jgi:ketosteroid isomerase-like protein